MIKQNPFSLYDFLGYFIPGALSIYLYFLISNHTDIKNIGVTFNQNKNFQLENLLFFIIISYSVGHLINFLSSITIERYANWKYNYPSKYLMDLVPDHKFLKKNKFLKLFLCLILFPISLLDFILGELFNFKALYTKKIDDFIIEAIKHKGIILLDQLGAPIANKIRDYDYHRIFSHYVFENSKNHQSKLTNYVVLYGFLRTLCLISTGFCWFIFFKLISLSYDFGTSIKYFKSTENQIFSLIIMNFVSYIFFMAFMKFYRRYSLETLMLIVIDKDIRDDRMKRPEITSNNI